MLTEMESVLQYSYFKILTTHLVKPRTGYYINYFFFPGNTDKRTNRSPQVLSHRTTKPNPKMPYHKDNYLSVSLSSQK